LNFLGCENPLNLFNSVPLLVLFVGLVLLIELVEGKFIEDIVRVNESSLRIVSHIVVFILNFGFAASAAVNNLG
jgi:hypothetical protein